MQNKNIYNLILNKDKFTAEDLDMSSIEMKSTREGFGDALLELGAEAPQVVALSADLTESVQMHKFRNKYPERFFEMGISEQNMASVASGLSAEGKIPFMASYAMFSPGRNWEQIRTTICYNNRKVIIVGAHAGLSVGPDGGTHQALEDIAILRSVPNITILAPADYYEAYAATKLAVNIDGPVYIRLTREKTPVLYSNEYNINLSQGDMYHSSKINSAHKVGVIAHGPIIFEVLIAAKELEKENIKVDVLNMSTIKPIDIKQLIHFAQNNGRKILTIEEHQAVGGLGSAVAEILSSEYVSQVVRMGAMDRFGQSGKADELYKEYNIDRESIKIKLRELALKY